MANYKNAYYDIYTINNYFWENNQGKLTVPSNNRSIHNYCHYRNNSGKDDCHDYFEMASSGVIHVLKTLKDKYNLEDDKLAEYAILFLSYKLNKYTRNKFANLNDFYTEYIETNNDYNQKIKDSDSLTYKDIINKKKDLMNIKEISNFDYPFNILLFLYNETNKNSLDCTKHSDYAKKFADEFEKLNKDSNNIGRSSYNKMLYRLSDDYNNLKNKCTDFPPLPKIKTPPSKLIPALSAFSVIPVFFGIAYKYSLFGVDKLFQRQYLRKKLKKITKKMKLNI
ncbi:PIR protein CIR protein [Plasmodium vinckei brucechwatti]|uniref:PIR protein CIR protein n=1 Tax=Plasmodium vinckei brucechwatti TaxID=119398 RepID=A0A6V7SCT9_PLAVN|nr:PIR protein CIR protein [Plasmodium vinckei brucechwatti]